VVWVGESVTLPEAFELVVTVRVDEPAVAVIVTDVALADCQFRVTVCPALIAPELAEKTKSGGPPLLSPLQPESANKATGIAPQVTQRNNFVFISLVALPSPKACDIQMPLPIPELAAIGLKRIRHLPEVFELMNERLLILKLKTRGVGGKQSVSPRQNYLSRKLDQA